MVEDSHVPDTMTIGDFSRATRLSAKALRFYHRVGLLEPAWVDPVNGYRVYSAEQIADAQLIRQFRALEMPVEVIREVVHAPGAKEKNGLIAEHLARMEAQLETTRSSVAVLRHMLAPPESPLEVAHRRAAPMLALVVRDTIDLADLGEWFTEARQELADALRLSGARQAGPRGGLWDTELFLDERGGAALFTPIAPLTDAPVIPGRARLETLPEVDFAVAVHRGKDDTVSEVYGALGDHVARHEVSAAGPIRETYLEETADPDGDAVTEIGWPISRPNLA
jgi:DNA-binding transcriptional MerR regulator